MEIYITYLLKILSFSSPFRRYEMKKFLYRPTMVADHISYLVAPPQNFFQFCGPEPSSAGQLQLILVFSKASNQKRIDSAYRRILCDVFALIFMSNRSNFWRQKMGFARQNLENKRKKKKSKERTKKNNHFFRSFITIKNTLFTVNLFQGRRKTYLPTILNLFASKIY